MSSASNPLPVICLPISPPLGPMAWEKRWGPAWHLLWEGGRLSCLVCVPLPPTSLSVWWRV